MSTEPTEMETTPTTSPIMAGGEAERAADYANYFCSYAYLYHQKQMLMDHVRMRAYHSAIVANRSVFEGKVVLDIGTGSGVLAIWAAQAGAAKVFAVEYTDMAKYARKLVESNGLSEVVEVIQSSVEDLQLPCKVDIIVSEWMGYILLRESMLDSVIFTRDKWLKPEGLMFPSHATMLWSAISNEEDRLGRERDYIGSMSDWHKFSHEMKNFYNVDVSSLTSPFEKEQINYYIFSSLWTELNVENVIAQPSIVKSLDLNTCTLADVEGIDAGTPFDITIPSPTRISGYACWFTVDFKGNESTTLDQPVTLSTGPEVGTTHWGQQVFYLRNPVDTAPNTRLHGTVAMTRQEKNKRLYDLDLVHQVNGSEPINTKYEIP